MCVLLTFAGAFIPFGPEVRHDAVEPFAAGSVEAVRAPTGLALGPGADPAAAAGVPHGAGPRRAVPLREGLALGRCTDAGDTEAHLDQAEQQPAQEPHRDETQLHSTKLNNAACNIRLTTFKQRDYIVQEIIKP